jgi:protein-tyrosine phosphatase
MARNKKPKSQQWKDTSNLKAFTKQKPQIFRLEVFDLIQMDPTGQYLEPLFSGFEAFGK